MTIRYVRADGVVWRRSFDRVLARSRATGQVTILGGSGPALWDVLSVPCSLEGAASALAAHFGAEADAVAADTAPVLDRLVELALVEIIAASAEKRADERPR